MLTFTEYLQEASFVGRAWEGKLSKINELLNWFDEKKNKYVIDKNDFYIYCSNLKVSESET